MLKTHYCSDLNLEKVGENVTLAGWIHLRRDHGKITFLDLRDSTGITQIVVVPKNDDLKKVASEIGLEFCVKIIGTVKERPEGMKNKNIPSGEVEIEAEEIEILSKSKVLPFEVAKDTQKVDEELRLKYRYLDLRNERMTKNITLRHEIVKFVRDYLCDKGFREIETPYLTKSTPEGAREYIVPSRLHAGEFYVLPQSPQQFKQLLMVGGYEKYFQIARCFRDEDQRGDRQPEFTQLDMEMSFIEQEDILQLVEKMITDMVKKVAPEKKITYEPFKRITYQESMEKYKTDKPDLRKNKDDKNELAFAWVVDMPLFQISKSEKKLVSSHHPFTMPNAEDIQMLDKNPEKVRAYAYDLVLNGFEIASGSIRIHIREIQDKIFDLLGVSEEEKQRRFGHMLEAFEFGAPPHGGIAPGIDRIVAIIAGEETIREVIAFPKTGDARDPMMGAPSLVSEKQLKDVHIQLGPEAKNKALKQADTETND
ncbi:MAG: aspartate--tRNA ligase [Candidatus Margulisiibacteriota bacterium]|jgi:aspartyl-tRNA synthetase